MFILSIAAVLTGAVIGIFLALKARKLDVPAPHPLDKATKVLNIALIPAYLMALPATMFLGMVSYPDHDGFLGVLGWIISFYNVLAPAACGIGLGLSVYLKKKGQCKKAFLVQFAGVAVIASVWLFYGVLVGKLLRPLN